MDNDILQSYDEELCFQNFTLFILFILLANPVCGKGLPAPYFIKEEQLEEKTKQEYYSLTFCRQTTHKLELFK